MIHFVDVFISHARRLRALLLACGLIVTIGSLFLLTPAERIGDALVQRITPLMVLGMMLAIQVLIFQYLWLERKLFWEQLPQLKPRFFIAGIVLLIFVLSWIWIAFSGIGVQPEPSGWFAPGTPVLAQQVVCAWAIGLAFILFGKRLGHSKDLNKLNFAIGLVLWLVAGLVWWMEPLHRWSYFTPAPTPPNFEYYPYSDAALYDEFAQNILVGTSRQIGLTHRPLYSMFLTLLHALAGQKFETILFLQVFTLAIMILPIYLLASDLGGRPAGVVAALIAILRERNSIVLTNIIEVSHVKLIMSDVPTMAMMLFFTYFFVKWLQDRQDRYYLGALAGAFFGFTILIRSQALLLIPIALLGIAISKKQGWRPILKRSLVFLVGSLVIIAPWVWRNYQVSGRVVVEYQEFYTRIFASGYSSAPQDVDLLSGETIEQYNARMGSLIFNFMINNPREVMRFYSSYFLHNEISSVVTLPMSPRFQGIYTYVKEMDFWNTPLGTPPQETLPMFFFSLCMIAVGVGTAFSRARWIGLMPLLFHLGYSFSVVPVRMSGWRYILPVDWVSFLYFSIGLVQITLVVLALFSRKFDTQFTSDEVRQPSSRPFARQRTAFTLTVFAVIGLSFPLLEWSIPERYPALDHTSLIQKFAPQGFVLDSGERLTASALEGFLETEAGSTVLYGRALYPAYYELGKYWGEASPNLIEASQYDRLQFDLIGSHAAFVYIPLQAAPKYFPHASDVFVVGCMQKGGVRALLIKVNDGLVVSSPFLGLTCSVLE